MAELFSQEWMDQYKEKWNAEPELAEALSEIGFNSVIGYGFEDEDQPRAYIQVENGLVTEAGDYDGQVTLNWDLRATPDNWKKWMNKPPGMMGLGMAYTSRKLKFNIGDYGSMVKDPRMAGPFIKSFTVMGRV